MNLVDRLNAAIHDLEVCIQDAADEDRSEYVLGLLFAAKNAAIDAVRALDDASESVGGNQ